MTTDTQNIHKPMFSTDFVSLITGSVKPAIICMLIGAVYGYAIPAFINASETNDAMFKTVGYAFNNTVSTGLTFNMIMIPILGFAAGFVYKLMDRNEGIKYHKQ